MQGSAGRKKDYIFREYALNPEESKAFEAMVSEQAVQLTSTENTRLDEVSRNVIERAQIVKEVGGAARGQQEPDTTQTRLNFGVVGKK